MDEQEIYEVEVNVPQGKMVSTDLVKQIAIRLQKTYQPPKKRNNQTDKEYESMVLRGDEFQIVVELALAQGYNPLSKTFHYWKMDDKIQVDDHYGTLLNWAQSKQPFTYTTEVISGDGLEGIVPNKDVVVRFKAIRRADQQARQQYFKTVLDAAIAAGVKFDEALEIADRKADDKFAVQADGVVKWNEFHFNNGDLNPYATPKGWTPGVTRAETRAIRNGIKRMCGVPMPEERKRLGLEVTTSQMAELAASVPMALLDQPAEVRERYMQLAANNQNQEAVRDRLPPGELHAIVQENVNLLRGRKDEPGIGDDYVDPIFPDKIDPANYFTEGQVVVEEEDPFPAGPVPVSVEPGLVEATQELGGVAVTTSEAPPVDPRVYTVEEARWIILACGYKSEEAVGLAVKSLIGKLAPVDEQGQVTDKTNLTALTEVELWNFTQYALRRAILNDVNLPIEVRLQRVPEIETSVNKPTTVKAAGEFMHNLLKMLNTNGQKMKRLATNG